MSPGGGQAVGRQSRLSRNGARRFHLSSLSFQPAYVDAVHQRVCICSEVDGFGLSQLFSTLRMEAEFSLERRDRASAS